MISFDCDGRGRDYRIDTMHENRETLYQVVSRYLPSGKKSKIVELGTFFGCSLFSMAQAVKDWKLEDVKLCAVDHFDGDVNMPGYESLPVEETVKRIAQEAYPDQSIEFIKSSFDNAVNRFEDGSIDILLIDGDHRYEVVKSDYKTWLPKVKKDGLIILHDTNIHGPTYGVAKFFSEIKEPKFNIKNRYGLGIVKKGKGDAYSSGIGLLLTNSGLPYTAVYGDYDNLRDHGVPILKIANRSGVVDSLKTPRMRAKFWKVKPHGQRDFVGCAYSVWMDGNVVVKDPDFIRKIAGRMKTERKPIALFRHPDRDNVYDEYGVCRAAGFLASPEKAAKQIKRYRADSEFDAKGAGLWCGTVIFRRHDHPKVEKFNNLWWEEIISGSIRDQISLPYVLQKCGIEPLVISGSLWKNPWIQLVPHARERSSGNKGV